MKIFQELLRTVLLLLAAVCMKMEKINNLWLLFFWTSVLCELIYKAAGVIWLVLPWEMSSMLRGVEAFLVSTKTRNDAVLEGIKPLNLLSRDNISQGGAGIVQFSY
ncbi:hypothetical protein NC652_026660 [Populus alba x Populus x berolinensis]|nr:hypothetical protein NC652_026660 [Populus alba x Populus x berolinensis]